MAETKKESVEVTLPADNRLSTDHFEIDANGNVVIKNKTLSDTLKKNIHASIKDADVNAVKVGVVVDM
jgi:hypothetical protein